MMSSRRLSCCVISSKTDPNVGPFGCIRCVMKKLIKRVSTWAVSFHHITIVIIIRMIDITGSIIDIIITCKHRRYGMTASDTESITVSNHCEHPQPSLLEWPTLVARSLFQWLVAARSGIALSRLLLPAHGTAHRHSLRHRRHCRHSSGIWRRTCLPRHTDGAVSAFY